MSKYISISFLEAFFLISVGIVFPFLFNLFYIKVKKYSPVDISRNRFLMWISVFSQILLLFPLVVRSIFDKYSLLLLKDFSHITPGFFYFLYFFLVSIWIVISVFPIISFPLIFIFSKKIVIKKEQLKLITPEENEGIKEIKSLFLETIKSFNKSPELNFYCKESLLPNIYIFGSTRIKLNIAITTEFLNWMNRKRFTKEELESIVSHEVGHVLNKDLNIASSIKLFDDLKILRNCILFSLILIVCIKLLGYSYSYFFYESFVGYKNLDILISRFASVFLGGFKYYFIVYILYSLIEMFVSSNFRFRELLADKQTLNLIEDKKYLINSLENFDEIFLEKPPEKIGLGLSFFHMSVLNPLLFLKKIIDQLSKRNLFSTRIIERVKSIYERFSFFYHSSHPKMEKRIEIIKKFENQFYDYIYGYGDYFLTGLVVFVIFVTGWVLLNKLVGSFVSWNGFINLGVIFSILLSILLVYINNAPLMTIKNNQIMYLIDDYLFSEAMLGLLKVRKITGSEETVNRINREAKKLLSKNILSFSPFFTVIPITTLFFNIPLDITFAALIGPILYVFFLLFVFCRSIIIRNRYLKIQ